MKEYTIDFDSVTSKMLLFDALKGLTGAWNVKLERKKDKRSNQQSRYLHGVLIPYIAQEIGDDELSVKEDLKALFLTYSETKYGQDITKVRSTSSLSTAEFEEFTEKIRVWAYHYLNLVLPLPNEVID